MFHSSVPGGPGSGRERGGARGQAVTASPGPHTPKGLPLLYLRGSGIRPLTAPVVEMEKLRPGVEEGFPRSQGGPVAQDSMPPGIAGLSLPSLPSA